MSSRVRRAAESVDGAIQWLYEGPFLAPGPSDPLALTRENVAELKRRLEVVDRLVDTLDEALDEAEYGS